MSEARAPSLDRATVTQEASPEEVINTMEKQCGAGVQAVNLRLP